MEWESRGHGLKLHAIQKRMTSQPAKTASIPLRQAVDYYFQIALHLLVLTGFVTLASTGGLDTPSVVLVGAAMAVRGYLLARRRPFVISERWTTPLTIAYFLFFAADYLMVSHSFLPATLHLALFGVVVRMFSLRRDRDYITMAILAFLMVLAAAILTVDSMFLFCFAAFMLVAVATFVLMEMRRSGHAATIHARHSSAPNEHRHLAFWLARVAPVLMLMILVGGAMLFFLMPRKQIGYLGGYAFGTDFSSGFSDRVPLGQIGEIQQSNAVVMHIQIEGDTLGRYDLHWRGVALSDFDGHTWSKSHEQFLLQHWADNSFAVPRLENAALKFLVTPSRARERMIHYRVLMEPIGTNVLFLAPWGRSIIGPYRLLAGDLEGTVYDIDIQHAVGRYEAYSDIASPSPAELRAAGRNFPPAIAATYLRLPALDPRIRRFAAQITASSRNDFDKATAIESYLRTYFAYTLELPRKAPEDPIANFLFERKRGHCEYFASSMAVMLRTLGIPSRVVNGFRSDEFNDLTGNYVIRAKDAHSWVEAYFPGYGWRTFDPTPGGSAGIPQGWGRLALYLDAMSSFWRDWIINYDTSHQYVLGQTAVNRTRNLWDVARDWARVHYETMLGWARHGQQRVEHAPGRWAVIGLGLALGLLILANFKRIKRVQRGLQLRAHPERSPQQAAAMWYQRMTRVVARKGVPRSAAHTPQEFVQRIEDARLRAPVAHFTEVYESARFGNSAEDVLRLPELYEVVELVTKE
jgi:transglutaminase-like putative cysteine protease